MFKFSKPYRNQKRKAAIWILNQLLVPKMTVTGTTNPPEEFHTRTYSDYDLTELIEKKKYDRKVLRDAIEILYSNGHIAFRIENQKNIYDCIIYTNYKGESAIKDEIYEDEIETYNNDKYYRYLRWWLPILALVISVISISLSTCKKSGDTIQVQRLEQQSTKSDTTNEPVVLSDSLAQTKTNDSSHTSKGQ